MLYYVDGNVVGRTLRHQRWWPQRHDDRSSPFAVLPGRRHLQSGFSITWDAGGLTSAYGIGTTRTA